MNAQILPSSFFHRSTVTVARELIGCRLISRIGRFKTGGLIVETEAYLAKGDSACHGVRGETASNAAMFGPAGRAYVYPIHAGWCFNIVTGHAGQASAVLIRALVPEFGLPVMKKRRGMDQTRLLTTGPSRLCQALSIDRAVDHWDLQRRSRLWVEPGSQEWKVIQTERIGVTSAQDKKLRFAVIDNRFVSGPKRLRSTQSKPG